MSKCRECGKAVSTLAKTCPSCGVPKPAKVLKKKTTTKKTKTPKTKKNKPSISLGGDMLFDSKTGSFDNVKKIKTPKTKKNIPYDSLGGDMLFDSKTGSFERESKKSKITKTNDKINKEEQRRRQEEVIRRNDEEQVRRNDEEQVRKEQRRREEEQERREQRQRTARQEAINYQTKAYNRTREEEQVSEQISSPSVSSSSQNKGEKNTFDKFADGHLDLATAFWGFGVFGSIIVGVVCGVLSEMVNKLFNVPYVILSYLIITMLWGCAENHKKIMTQQKQSGVWGVLTQVFCVFSGLGLIGFIFANK